jgi:sterol desaturase/sphingolipid hydroxylase (fatty acid hydroxylase superfamily)
MPQLLNQFPDYIVELCRASLWLLLIMLIFVPLERLFPLRQQAVFRKAFGTDLVYYFFSSLIPKFVWLPLMSIVALWLHSLAPSSLYTQIASLPLGVRFLVALVVGEIGAYWGHRWMHEIPWLWRFHAIHHSAEHIDWLVNTRAHPIDLVFVRFCALVPMYILGVAQPMDNRLDTLPIIITLVGTIWGFFIHANLRWRFGYLEWLIATPHFHHWHHTNDSKELINKNYAATLPWIDKLFGTFYLPQKQWPDHYGINGHLSNNIVLQIIRPFLAKN